jgi:hypothetical protein
LIFGISASQGVPAARLIVARSLRRWELPIVASRDRRVPVAWAPRQPGIYGNAIAATHNMRFRDYFLFDRFQFAFASRKVGISPVGARP